MNTREVSQMLAELSAIDPTVPRPSRDVLTAWASMLDEVPLATGQEAVRAYYQGDAYAEHKRTITPADIYQHHRATRRQQAEERHNRELTEQRAAISGAPRPVRSLATQFAIEKARQCGGDPVLAEAEVAARRSVLSVPCPHPHCRAPQGVRCTSFGGRPLRQAIAHPSRLEAASKQATTQP